jgi:hypothetical protein
MQKVLLKILSLRLFYAYSLGTKQALDYIEKTALELGVLDFDVSFTSCSVRTTAGNSTA